MIGELVIVLVVAAGTLAIRSSMVSLLAGRRLSPALEAALSLVAPAALAGLVAQTLLLDAGAVRGIGSWHVAAAGAALVALSSISFVSRAWSSEPQLTPMRTGLS